MFPGTPGRQLGSFVNVCYRHCHLCLLGAFWIYWLVASAGVKAGRTRWSRFAGSRVAIVLIIFLLLRLKVIKGHHVVTSDPWLQAIGLVIFLLGLALAIWARVYLGRNWGMPMTEKADPELVTTGPYSTIRHPIYSGLILAMAGTRGSG